MFSYGGKAKETAAKNKLALAFDAISENEEFERMEKRKKGQKHRKTAEVDLHQSFENEF